MRQSALDSSVKKIKIIIYRLANNSGITTALLTALNNGKKVTVVIELKARFDESANLGWTELLREAGAKIIFTPEYLKVHAKLIAISRQEGEKNVHYIHVGTGNF